MIRYPQHRPEGLVVDATGKVELSNLMSVWASAEGLTETHILDTVEAHKWQDTETMTPRYSLLGEDGSFQIRVHKPRRELQQRKSMPSKPRSSFRVLVIMYSGCAVLLFISSMLVVFVTATATSRQ
ncbi:unnamed protein product [Symbiodinium necroappetens]|uniref:Uncharacterized protein n=1 Tax=Symbiodinium necroappetens TaxID=1628268 RepID=A0A812QPK9_9DINO|nr:unnamed protein product [Symbiodinium necroappetens]